MWIIRRGTVLASNALCQRKWATFLVLWSLIHSSCVLHIHSSTSRRTGDLAPKAAAIAIVIRGGRVDIGSNLVDVQCGVASMGVKPKVWSLMKDSEKIRVHGGWVQDTLEHRWEEHPVHHPELQCSAWSGPSVTNSRIQGVQPPTFWDFSYFFLLF